MLKLGGNTSAFCKAGDNHDSQPKIKSGDEFDLQGQQIDLSWGKCFDN